jgi:hypothetical protein
MITNLTTAFTQKVEGFQRIVFLLLLVTVISPAYGQDLMKTWESGELEEIYIQRITGKRLVYRLEDNKEATTIKRDLKEIQELHQVNGDTLYFLDGEQVPISPDEMFLRGRNDASQFYPGSRAGEIVVLVGSSIQPIIAYIGAFLISEEPPKDENLNYPDPALMEDNSYNVGYLHEASNKKERRVMNRFLVGMGVNLAVTAFILLN